VLQREASIYHLHKWAKILPVSERKRRENPPWPHLIIIPSNLRAFRTLRLIVQQQQQMREIYRVVIESTGRGEWN